jgi:uncharacterized membrane protein YbhN (UPF0104 family)
LEFGWINENSWQNSDRRLILPRKFGLYCRSLLTELNTWPVKKNKLSEVSLSLKRLLSIVKILILFGVLFFILRYLIFNWNQFISLDIKLNYVYVILSFLVMQLAWITTAWSWGKTLEAFGHKLRYRDIFTIYFRSMVAKYVPGKVWQLAASTYIAGRQGIPEGATIVSFIVGQAYSVLSGVTLIAAAVALGAMHKTGGGFAFFRWSSIPILIALLVLIIRPNISERFMNLALRIFKRQEISMNIRISTSFWLFFAFLIPWLIFGMAFWLLINALTPVPFNIYFTTTAILTAGTVVGFLAVFAPGGIGVKEASIAALIVSTTSLPAAFALAIGFGYRIVTSIVELVDFGITWMITPRQK